MYVHPSICAFSTSTYVGLSVTICPYWMIHSAARRSASDDALSIIACSSADRADTIVCIEPSSWWKGDKVSKICSTSCFVDPITKLPSRCIAPKLGFVANMVSKDTESVPVSVFDDDDDDDDDASNIWTISNTFDSGNTVCAMTAPTQTNPSRSRSTMARGALSFRINSNSTWDAVHDPRPDGKQRILSCTFCPCSGCVVSMTVPVTSSIPPQNDNGTSDSNTS
mmetsp:Transcript_1909/g.4403  ORF Transcript_1909/g.4403 Transcript_1909/m.4403 type:complete len:224 (+) Transcript_1909:3039-3710(+)